MTHTVEKIFNPLSLITFIFGCGILRHPLGQSRYRLSIFYMLTVWSVYAYGVYYIINHFFMVDIFPSFLATFMVIMNLLVTMKSIISTIYKHEKFYICLKKLDLVNDTLEELGTPKEYHSLRNGIKWTLIIWFLMICTTWTFDTLTCTSAYNDVRAVIIPIIMNYSLYINSIMDIIFMILLRYIGTRLDIINDFIVHLSEIEDCRLRHKWKKSLDVNIHYLRNAESRKRILWIIIHLHLELCRIARNINSFFGMQMTLQMLSYFVVLIGIFIYQYNIILNLYKVYNNDIALKVLLTCNTWCIIFLIKLISLNHICENVSAKAKKSKDIIHKLTNLICFDVLRDEISQFPLQILLRPLQFSGLGMFYFGYGFVRKFFTWILTAALFMMQINVPKFRIFLKHNTTYYN